MTVQAGIVDPPHARVVLQEVCDLRRVPFMLAHAQREQLPRPAEHGEVHEHQIAAVLLVARDPLIVGEEVVPLAGHDHVLVAVGAEFDGAAETLGGECGERDAPDAETIYRTIREGDARY